MADWKRLGLRCGLEIHQQLDTPKLFCDCPSEIRDDSPDIQVMRQLRASAGEGGAIDVAAAAEQAKGKRYLYQAYADSTCLVELDAEPPHEMQPAALEIILQLAKLLGSEPLDVVQVMRKTVVDGSNTSGFQRTSLVARNGLLKTDAGDVSIPSLCLEEDAAKIVERGPDQDTYNLSRLGIPLIEITTAPDMYTPEHVKEVAGTLGMLLRSTGRVKRGLGTIRQDLNISIKAGTRIEIKGAQDLDMVPTLVEEEARRQETLVEIAAELKKRKAKLGLAQDVTRALAKTQSKIIRAALDRNDGKGVVLGAKLSGFVGILGREVQVGRRLGTELSDHAKVLGGVKGLFHSDELPKYGIMESEVKAVAKALGCKKHDGFIIIADAEDKARPAIAAALARAEEALEGVPKEVRKANQDGSSSFLRPMPGAARMYPETDVRGIRIANEFFKEIPVPELLSEKSKRLEKDYKLPAEVAHQIAWTGFAEDFESALKRHKNLQPQFVADVLITYPKDIKKRYNLELKATTRQIEILFSAVNSGRIAKDAAFEILLAIARNDIQDIERDGLAQFELMSDSDVKKTLSAIVKKNKGAPFNALIGMAMKELRGKAEGKKIAQLLKELTS